MSMSASNFHCFGLLPTELRLAIWKLAAQHCKMIIWLSPIAYMTALESPDDLTNDLAPKKDISRKWLTSTTTPGIIKALSETCRESSEYIHENFPIWENLYHHPLSTRTSFRCNLDHTTVYLSIVGAQSRAEKETFLDLLPAQATLTRSLIIEYVRDGFYDIDPVLKVLRNFPHLERLVVITIHNWAALGIDLAFVNTFGSSTVEDQISEVDEAVFDEIRNEWPEWKMPSVLGLESGGNHDRIDELYRDIFPEPGDAKWKPFRRMDAERKWHDVDEV